MDEEIIISGYTLEFIMIFDDFQTYLDETRDPIYRMVLSAFGELKEKEMVTVNVVANVDGNEFKTELEYTKSNLDILTDVINPYFEKLEDYETCAVIMKLHSELIS